MEILSNPKLFKCLFTEWIILFFCRKFYSVYGSPKIQVVTDLTDDKTPTVCQR
jgi:hypothetical protein